MLTAIRRVLVVLALFPAFSQAQSVHGVVRDGIGAPLQGVVVLLLAPDSSTAARALTNDRGEYAIVARGSGSYRLKTMRIGYSSMMTPAFVLTAGEPMLRDLSVSNVAISLDSIHVSDRQVCKPGNSQLAFASFAVWEQVRTALAGAEATTLSGVIDAKTVAYERRLENKTSAIVTQKTDVIEGPMRQPWQFTPPDSLHANGYVVVRSDSITYATPGFDALLDASFLADHCLTLVEGTGGEIGIEFEPTFDRRQIPDIRGTLWINRRTSELQRIEYSFANLSRMRATDAGGELTFAHLRDGNWIVPHWKVRMPLVATIKHGQRIDEVRVTGMKEAGGELALVMRDGDTLWKHPPLTLRGTLVDSVSGSPVQGIFVAMAGSKEVVLTNFRGNFTFTGVLPGKYRFYASAPFGDYAGLGKTFIASVIDSANRIVEKVQSAQQAVAVLCEDQSIGNRSARVGVVTGAVDTTYAHAPMSAVTVRADWIETSTILLGSSVVTWLIPHTASVHPLASGRYGICAVERGTGVTVQAFADSERSLPLTVNVSRDAHFASANLSIDGELLPVATYIGTVVNDSSGTPLAGLEISIPDLELTGVSNERGEFYLTEITGGSHLVSVRGPGVVPFDTTMSFVPKVVNRTRLMVRRAPLRDVIATNVSPPRGQAGLAGAKREETRGRH